MGEWWQEFRGRGVKAALQAATRYAANEAAIDALLASGASVLHQAAAPLTHDQIRQLPTIAVQIVAAPAANKLIIPVAGAYLLHLVVDYASLSVGFYGLHFSWSDGQTAGLLAPQSGFLDWGGPADVISFASRTLTGKVDGGADFPVDVVGFDASTALGSALNIKATNAAGNYTGGDASNTLLVSTTYLIWNTTTGVFE